jgi:hypothetical protein
MYGLAKQRAGAREMVVREMGIPGSPEGLTTGLHLSAAGYNLLGWH